MSMIGVTRAAYASVSEKIYSAQVSLSVYVGLVRASIQEKIPFLSKHRYTSILLALFVVAGIQSIMVMIVFASKLFSMAWVLPSLIGGLLAYVPLVNKWV